jgi:hypothetical protein
MKLGVVADIHGNDTALRAVLADAGRFGVDRWWALGDLVLFGPRPAEVLEMLRVLLGIDAARKHRPVRPDRRAARPAQDHRRRRRTPRPGRTICGHGLAHRLDQGRARPGGSARPAGRPPRAAAPAPGRRDRRARRPCPGGRRRPGNRPRYRRARARAVAHGVWRRHRDRRHTHSATDRVVNGIRALSPGSTGLPRNPGSANWLLLDDDGGQLAVTLRAVPYDAEAVAADMYRRRHPNADFVTSILTGARQF